MQAQGRDSLLNRITIPVMGNAVTIPRNERTREMFISRDIVKEREQRDIVVRQQLHEAKEREAKMREQDMRLRPQQYSG